MTLAIRPLREDDLEDVGRLLAARHARHLAACPLLNPLWAQVPAATEAVRAAWAVPGASGALATRGGRAVGHLLGSAKDEGTWGANAWVESAGLALADGEDMETARDLYATAAARWVDEGHRAHYVLVPAHDRPLVDAFFHLAFGLQHVHAARRPPSGPPAEPPAGVTVRRAVRSDVPLLGQLDVELPEHQGRSPVFASSGPVPTVAEAVDDWARSFDDERFTTFVAEHGGEPVGSAVGCDLGVSSQYVGPMHLPLAGFLGFAAVLPHARGLGVGRALGEAFLAWTADGGRPYAVTDWRATNLLSSRAWPRLGFEPTFWRLHRVVGH